MKIKFAAVVCGLVFAGSVIAADQGGVQVGGSLEQTVKTGDNLNAAMGQGAKATQEIGVIEGNVQVGGGLQQTVKTGDNMNMAVGDGTEASQRIGTISGKE